MLNSEFTPLAIALEPLIPWGFVAFTALVGVGLEALLRWDKRFQAFSLFRGALILYALALGISLAPFPNTGKNEIIEDRAISLLATIASIIVIQRLTVRSISSF